MLGFAAASPSSAQVLVRAACPAFAGAPCALLPSGAHASPVDQGRGDGPTAGFKGLAPGKAIPSAWWRAQQQPNPMLDSQMGWGSAEAHFTIGSPRKPP
jgi:hypothetical protein